VRACNAVGFGKLRRSFPDPYLQFVVRLFRLLAFGDFGNKLFVHSGQFECALFNQLLQVLPVQPQYARFANIGGRPGW